MKRVGAGCFYVKIKISLGCGRGIIPNAIAGQIHGHIALSGCFGRIGNSAGNIRGL